MTLARVGLLGGALLGLLGACGGSTKQSPADTDSGGSDRGGISAAGNSAPAGAANGGRAVGGTSGNVGGIETGGVSQAGAPDTDVAGRAQGGSGDDPEPVTCNSVYKGPTGRPRVDGPLPINCVGVTDQVILARYKDFKARMPMGLYYEPADLVATWESPCSSSLAETVKRAAARPGGTFDQQFTTDWFYEAEFCRDGLRHVYRNLRCDYFDGQKMPKQDPEALAFLASLLWWGDNANLDGSALIGYSVSIGNATDWVELCTINTVHGDFGLCDEITLQTTTDTILYDGTVKLGQPKTLRTIKGDCH